PCPRRHRLERRHARCTVLQDMSPFPSCATLLQFNVMLLAHGLAAHLDSSADKIVVLAIERVAELVSERPQCPLERVCYGSLHGGLLRLVRVPCRDVHADVRALYSERGDPDFGRPDA